MFEDAGYLRALNEDQRCAATHPSGPLLVLAGAGTGKTQTLTARAAWLLAEGLPADRLLLLTFTRRAADEMLGRLALSRAAESGSSWGGTFHAIAHRLIRRHGETFGLPEEFSILDPADVVELLDLLRADHGLVAAGRRAPRAQACADIYTRCVNRQSTLTEIVTTDFPWCADFVEQLGGLYRAYVAHKQRHALVDFDDLLLLWRAALADTGVGPVLRARFGCVLVDEYQDVNSLQADIVWRLCPDGAGLTCVGDPAQAVYGFRGADPGHLLALRDRYPNLIVVRLTRNYRSRDPVLDLANAVRPPQEGFNLALRGCRGKGPRALLVRCHDEATQAREVCRRVLEAVEAGRALRDQAVLVRSAQHSDVLELELTARRIPYVKYGGLRFTEAAHVKDFIAATRLVGNPADDVAWFRVLKLHDGVGTGSARRMLAILRPAEPAPFDRWPAALEVGPPACRDQLAHTIDRLIEARNRRSPSGLAGAILEALREVLVSRYPDHAARLSDLERLVDAARSYPSLQDAIAELTLDPARSSSDLAGPPQLDEDYLVVSTMHSAKGLEWPVVHVIQLVDGAVPADMALSAPKGLAEEHRLFYVAMTRARDELLLYAPLRVHHRRTARDDRHSYAQLTRFLGPAALAACDAVTVAPARAVAPEAALVRQRVSVALDSLWR
jgi:DNA helicase II / ATP-dependent DNA helicase PcrA